MPADVVSELVARKVMSSSIIVVQLVRNAMEEAVTIRLYAQNVASVGEVWLPELIGTLQICHGRLGIGIHYITIDKSHVAEWLNGA